MENQRVRLTKALLKNALIHILQKKPIEKITIYELCDQAQINRTTFYKYYGSQYDLLNDIENDLFSELDRHLAAIDQEELDNLKQVMEYLLEEQEKCTVLINTVPDQEFSEKLFSLPAVHALMQGRIPGSFTAKQKEYARIFIFQGGYAIIRQWLNDKNRESPEEIAETINRLVSMLLHGAPGPSA